MYDEAQWTRLYRAVFFQTEEGRAVFEDVLQMLGFGKPIVTDEDRHWYNIAVELLKRCGVTKYTATDLNNMSIAWENDDDGTE